MLIAVRAVLAVAVGLMPTILKQGSNQAIRFGVFYELKRRMLGDDPSKKFSTVQVRKQRHTHTTQREREKRERLIDHVATLSQFVSSVCVLLSLCCTEWCGGVCWWVFLRVWEPVLWPVLLVSLATPQSMWSRCVYVGCCGGVSPLLHLDWWLDDHRHACKV